MTPISTIRFGWRTPLQNYVARLEGVDVVVVGSMNRDITVLTPRLPDPGETVLGERHHSGGGGKGANQAIAAARLGSRVAMVGRVGDDEAGHVLRDGLADEGIDVTWVGLDSMVPTGLALITVDARAENTIVVSPGANATLGPDHLPPQMLTGATVVLAQLEIPIDTVIAAAAATKGLFLLNPAPAAALPPDLLERLDVLIPNRTELGILASTEVPATTAEAVAAVKHLGRDRPTVVTLGGDGALIVEGGDAIHIPAVEVDPIDPTGAGDAFCGALAHALAAGLTLEVAVGQAVIAGAIATTRSGAQAAMPNERQVADFSTG